MDNPQKNKTDANEHELLWNFLIQLSFKDVTNLINSQNALAAAAAAAAVAANSATSERLTPEIKDARLKLSSAAVAHINGTSEYIYRSKLLTHTHHSTPLLNSAYANA